MSTSALEPCHAKMLDGTLCPLPRRDCYWHRQTAKPPSGAEILKRWNSLDTDVRRALTEVMPVVEVAVEVVESMHAGSPNTKLHELIGAVHNMGGAGNLVGAKRFLDSIRQLAALSAGRGSPGDDDAIRGVGGPIRVAGRWRVYFHRLNPDGLPWCVSSESGAWELAVRSVGILVPTQAVYQPKAKPDDDDGRPSAWIEADGLLVVSDDGRATIEAA